jgi:hypothetical protein
MTLPPASGSLKSETWDTRLKVWRLQLYFRQSVLAGLKTRSREKAQYLPIGVVRARLSIFRESGTGAIDAGCGLPYIHCTMQAKDFDQLLKEYRQAIDAWVAAIQAEEALANDDHSMVEMEKWDAAGFTEHDAEAVAKKARDQYKSALRKKNYGF